MLDTLHSWPGVTSRRMFGGTSYFIKGRMFAFRTRDSLVIKLPEKARAQAMDSAGARPFIHTFGPFGQWTEFPVKPGGDTEALRPWLKKCFDYVSVTPPKSRRLVSRR